MTAATGTRRRCWPAILATVTAEDDHFAVAIDGEAIAVIDRTTTGGNPPRKSHATQAARTRQDRPPVGSDPSAFAGTAPRTVTVIPDLHDDVVILNHYADEDLPAHLAGEDEETARRFGWWPKTSTPATVRDAFARWAHDWETGGPVRAFATREQATGRLVGGCELHIKPGGPANVSYWTSATDRGRGHATRSLALLLDYARSIGIGDAEAHIAADNRPSRRVAEKAGFLPASTYTAEDGTGMIRYQIHLTNS
jgi:RimJ/RimL family protein N-acetyltransferase